MTDMFKEPVYVDGRGWYVVQKGTFGERYLRATGVVDFGVYPDGYFDTREKAIEAIEKYNRRNCK